MTRDEHLAWCREKAMPYAEAGDTTHTLASMRSDIAKHDETARDRQLLDRLRSGLERAAYDEMNTADELRAWVEGFR